MSEEEIDNNNLNDGACSCGLFHLLPPEIW